jgi:hypothetical protein
MRSEVQGFKERYAAYAASGRSLDVTEASILEELSKPSKSDLITGQKFKRA